MSRVRTLTWWERFTWGLRRWQGFPYPLGETVHCVKVRTEVGGMLEDIDFGVMADQRIGGNSGAVSSDGRGPGTPMQNGRIATRPLTYGRWTKTTTRIPLPAQGGYWVTAWPTPMFDERCIIAGPDPREVVEMLQFKPDQSADLPAGFSQQAQQFGRWYDGELIEGSATTATGLPAHPYVWGPGSLERPHAQALVLADYVGADGNLDVGPVAGDWYALDPSSLSYRRMIAAGGECAARAIALVIYGCRLIDMSHYEDVPSGQVGNVPRPPSLHTQAGSWVASTNLAKFSVALSDLKRVIG